MIICRAFLAALAVACLVQGPVALAQTYPSKPIRVVVPFSPGSATDIVARTFSDKLAANLGQPLIVENKPGAGGTIGTGQVARAAPDGYTLAVVSAGHAINPAIYDQLPYDTAKDFRGVIPLAKLPSVLVVPAGLGVKTTAELIAMAKAKPGELNFCSAGIGSASHVNAEKFRAVAGINAVHVPLKGSPEMVSEITTGRAQFGFVPIVAALTAIRDGRVVGLAVSSANRSPALPNVPTLAEAGLPAAEFNFWIGLLAPAQTPREIVGKLNDEVVRALQTPEVRDRFANLGAEPMPMKPEQFDAFMSDELSVLGKVMRAAGVKAN